jgi:malonyl-CoA O-methyltransferase
MTSRCSSRWSDRVRSRFGRRAASYEGLARLQRGMAWRLACSLDDSTPLPEGPRADLGAGSGLLSAALLTRHPDLRREPPLQLDLCPELLACNHQGEALVWDLNEGLPARLRGAALLTSSFALHWLDKPAAALGQWCRQLRPGGRLLLAVPTAGSFPQWHAAAAAAGVPCTALPLPNASCLREAAIGAGLDLQQCRLLRFSRPHSGGLSALRQIQRLGAGATPCPPLAAAQLRHLLAHWPEATPLTWHVLLLCGRIPPDTKR